MKYGGAPEAPCASPLNRPELAKQNFKAVISAMLLLDYRKTVDFLLSSSS